MKEPISIDFLEKVTTINNNSDWRHISQNSTYLLYTPHIYLSIYLSVCLCSECQPERNSPLGKF